MKFTYTFIIICTVFLSCTKSEHALNNQSNIEDSTVLENNIDSLNTIYHQQNINFDQPVVIDSSDWVYFALTHGEKGEYSKSLSSKKKNQPYGIWNMIFYNVKTKEYRLLSDKKMIITYPYYDPSTQTPLEENSKLFYYSIINDDYNKDGLLTDEDPTYLYISDLSGKDFKQISPNHYDLISYEKLENTNKVLIQALKDSNQDNAFNYNDDEVVNFVYDLNLNQIEEVFDEKFNLKIKKLFVDQWNNKKE